MLEISLRSRNHVSCNISGYITKGRIMSEYNLITGIISQNDEVGLLLFLRYFLGMEITCCYCCLQVSQFHSFKLGQF